MTNVVTRAGESLSARLKAATRDEHERTESSSFIVDLVGGRLDRDAYAALLGQSYLFYAVLEQAGETWRDDPVVGPFVSDALVREAALAADLSWLRGAGWRDTLTPLPATRRYVDRLRAVCFDSPSAFLAHHYTRYLGDLSGGQIIRHHLRTHYGLTEDGVRFYTFDQVGKPKLFKDGYRGLLDALPWGADEQDRLMAEANEAFRLNRAVFDDLGQANGAGPTPS
ncbi:biliverdin-producing heme oxygenase [Actinophytocola xinjiangensis]|uniref:Biliverdin-producing heme oxygenase n=1 Tax=Actinophytocola xinjiangensis TaxID=485602 RepID=A0A7Z0WL62_9PSEU|nr:biliverdin-producing heme oxygenase [Actinophytocola xinjiangensis]OLF08783.1 biliverdin-producing heme oxygenase [Actinophytocola xinjiangensis]